MQTIAESSTLQAIQAVAARATPPAPAAIPTTLYDLIAALQDAAGPGEDTLVVAAVAHLMRSGRLTWWPNRPHSRRVPSLATLGEE
jgi:hypothetical protein